MVGRRGFNNYFLLAAFILLIIVWIPHTSLPDRSQRYFQKLIPNSNGWQLVNPTAASPPSEAPPDAPPSEKAPADSPPPAKAPEVSPPNSHHVLEESPASTSVAAAEPAATGDAESDAEGESKWGADKWFFEYPLHWLPLPKWDLEKMAKQTPHNYKGPGHPTFATFYASRNATLWDPYFIATQEIVYRVLWHPETRSTRHPMVVFVPPFVPQEQRDMFAAAGAIVREVALHPFEPNQDVVGFVAGRLRDVFSKLEMWRHTEFSKVAYLDSDAFPIENIDGIFDVAPERECKPELLKPIDKPNKDKLCDYIYTGFPENYNNEIINVGVLVFKPNLAMYDLIIRESRNQSQYDNGFVEQALLSYVFRRDGPFPPDHLTISWNGSPDVKDRGDPLYIIHAKLWALFYDAAHWASPLFNQTWYDLYELYSSDRFAELRVQEGHADLNA